MQELDNTDGFEDDLVKVAHLYLMQKHLKEEV